MTERTPKEYVEEMWGAYMLGDGRDQTTARVAAVAAWEADRARIAELTAQRDALVPMCDRPWHLTDDEYRAATAALWAIEQEGRND